MEKRNSKKHTQKMNEKHTQNTKLMTRDYVPPNSQIQLNSWQDVVSQPTLIPTHYINDTSCFGIESDDFLFQRG